MDNFEYELKRLCYRYPENSQATQRARLQTLCTSARALKQHGFRNMHATSIKPRHVQVLVTYWQQKRLSIATQKNKLVHLRWWAEKIGNPAAIPSNIALDVVGRVYRSSTGAPVLHLTDAQIEAIKDDSIRWALKLMLEFGLRREEALKFEPRKAIRDDMICIQFSPIKRQIQRRIPILTEAQRQLTDQLLSVCRTGSLIPPYQRYVDQVHLFEYQSTQLGLSCSYGLRRQYARRRYQALMGEPCTLDGGKAYTQMTVEEKRKDQRVLKQIRRELGLVKASSIYPYLGR